jgi:hypothetical protein
LKTIKQNLKHSKVNEKEFTEKYKNLVEKINSGLVIARNQTMALPNFSSLAKNQCIISFLILQISVF